MYLPHKGGDHMPNKYAPGTVSKNVRMQQALKDRLDATAKTIGISANKIILDAITHELDLLDKVNKKSK